MECRVDKLSTVINNQNLDTASFKLTNMQYQGSTDQVISSGSSEWALSSAFCAKLVGKTINQIEFGYSTHAGNVTVKLYKRKENEDGYELVSAQTIAVEAGENVKSAKLSIPLFIEDSSVISFTVSDGFAYCFYPGYYGSGNRGDFSAMDVNANEIIASTSGGSLGINLLGF